MLIYFFIFLEKGPHLFSISNKTKKEGGLLLATTIGDSLGRTSYLCFSFEFSKLPKQKIFQKIKLYYRKTKYIMILLVNDILFLLFPTLIIYFLKLVLVSIPDITWFIQIKTKPCL